MKKIPAVVAVLCLSIVFSAKAYALSPQDFTIESFDAQYYLGKSSENAATLSVQESLVAIFPEYDQNHGILRAIPKSYKNHTLSLGDIKVTDERSVPYQFSSYTENNNMVLKIGNPNSYVHGRTIYKISYKVQDVASFYDNHDEFYWDVNGDQWQQPFGTVTATIHISKQIENSLQDNRRCYSGFYGSLAQSCSITLTNSNETLVNAKADNLSPHQTLSVVLGFKKGTFAESSAVKKERQQNKIKLTTAIALAVTPPILAFMFMFRRWRQFGDDPKGRGIIVPEYEPPKDFNLLTSDYLLQEKLRNKALSATYIDMAIKGYITIIEIPKKGIFGHKDYKLVLNKTPAEGVPKEVQKALNILFGNDLTTGVEVKLSELKKDYSRQRTIYKSMKSLENSLADKLTHANYFIKNPKDVRNGYQIWAGVLFFVVFVLGWLAASLQAVVLIGLLIGVLLASVIVFCFSFIMPARTIEGVNTHDSLLGLKDYIKLAEADRLKFLQSPEGAEKITNADEFDPKTPQAKVKLFEKLLPYAMLFDLEKQWAKQFNDIYKSAPDWYQGNWSSFNAGYLAGSLSDFSSASTTSFSSPSSSSGSGFSGGGAGGGGGGGGGGGW